MGDMRSAYKMLDSKPKGKSNYQDLDVDERIVSGS
jgi:hypothetical protein